MDKQMQKLLVQLRKIEEHRERGANTAIRKAYQEALKDIRQFLGVEYAKLAQEDKLTYEILRGKQEYARFLEEVEQRFSGLGKREMQEIQQAVESMYETAYTGLVQVVSKASDIDDAKAFEAMTGFYDTAQARSGYETLASGLKAGMTLSPEVVKAAVENPIAGLTLKDTLERHRSEIIYNIKRQIGIGLTNGDRMSTMAKRIQDSLEGDYKKALTIARTEVHRVREAGHENAAEHLDKVIQEGKSGKHLVKIWRTMKDARVRPNQLRKTKKGWKHSRRGKADHEKMEGQTVLATELFDLGGGVKTKAPGQSGVAAQDINCRCFLEYDLMTDEEYFVATGKHFPAKTQSATPDALEEAGFIRISAPRGYVDDVKAVNPKFAEDMKFQINCSHTVPAYEMRRRGYDVVATGAKNDDKYKAAGMRAWGYADHADAIRKGAVTPLKATRCAGAVREIEEVVTKAGVGARFEIRIGWKTGGGHFAVCENIDGKAVFIDPQNGEIGDSVRDYLMVSKPSQTWYTRIDNIDLDPNIMKEVCEVRK